MSGPRPSVAAIRTYLEGHVVKNTRKLRLETLEHRDTPSTFCFQTYNFSSIEWHLDDSLIEYNLEGGDIVVFDSETAMFENNIATASGSATASEDGFAWVDVFAYADANGSHSSASSYSYS
jgi:hypothetical protein